MTPVDVPAGDIGVGEREISYIFGMYKRVANRFTGTLTGKGLAFAGSLIRTDATGYGSAYFMREMLAIRGDGVKGKTAVVSGAGNVALPTIEKLTQLGAEVATASDSGGFVHHPDGIGPENLERLKDLKTVRRGRVREYAEKFGCEFRERERPRNVPCDLAFPSATQNELRRPDSKTLLENGVVGVSEGTNMPTDPDGMQQFLDARILSGPATAANAGGVAVSGLEKSQNALRISWSREQVNEHLERIMKNIHGQCVQLGQEEGWINSVRGANVAGFVKIADAMLASGSVQVSGTSHSRDFDGEGNRARSPRSH